MKKKIGVAFALIFVAAAALAGIRFYNQHRFHVEKQTRFLMDTFVTVYAVGPERVAKEAIERCFDRMREIDDKFDSQNERGPIHAFNREGTPIDDPEILKVAETALRIAEETDGALDVTVGPLIELWGFYGDRPKAPSPEAVEACLRRVGYQRLSIGPNGLEKDDPEVRIDLGAIAKGYAIGEAAATLRRNGVRSGLIDAGGDIYALGARGSRPWNVGLRNPRRDGLLGYVEVEETAVMGSGDYERFFVEDGVRYHHIFDPKTGYPARGVSGVTLIHPDPMLADAWNTALFVMGAQKALEAADRIENMEIVVVAEDGEVRFSSGLENALRSTAETTGK